MAFSDQYRRLVAPRLQRLAQFQALQVVTDTIEFEEAHAALMTLAYRLGAGSLSRQQEEDVNDACLEWLMEAIEAVLPEWQEAQALAGKVARDIARFEDQL